MDISTLKYDPKNTAGADEATVLIAVIDNKIIDLLRKQSGRQRGYERYLKQKGYTDPQRQSLSYCENYALRCDLKQAIAALSDRQKAVCLGIMEGWSIREIARRLHCRQETVRRTIKAIGRTFKARGIDQWFR